MILKPENEIPNQVRDDKKVTIKFFCRAELVSASDLFFLSSAQVRLSIKGCLKDSEWVK
jgi:hypothetical protein